MTFLKMQIATASLKTLGCRLNQAEMESLARQLQSRGIAVRPFGEAVDLTVINTCTVTHDADRDSRYAVRQAIRRSPRGRVVVTGCYAQMSPEAVRAIEGVDLVLGNSEKSRFMDYLDLTGFARAERITATGPSRTRVNLKIQDGCDYHCSFCIIPFARGRARSLDFGGIVREAESLVAQGFKEIVLTGVNIGTYFSEEGGRRRRFVDLVERLQETQGLSRLRISSIEPNTVTDRLLQVMSRSSVVCPHLHIPIQSASDPILMAMRRKYRKTRLERLIDKIRDHLPEAGIGTDVIVGFPGEAEEHLKETLRFVESTAFSYLHVFPFSAREGTPAHKMAGANEPQTIHRRAKVLRALGQDLHSRFARRFSGKTMPVLFEEPEGDRQTGLTANYLRVNLSSPRNLSGQIHDVTLERFETGGFQRDPQTLSGQIA